MIYVFFQIYYILNFSKLVQIILINKTINVLEKRRGMEGALSQSYKYATDSIDKQGDQFIDQQNERYMMDRIFDSSNELMKGLVREMFSFQR